MGTGLDLDLARLAAPTTTGADEHELLRAIVRSDRLTRLVALARTVRTEAELGGPEHPFQAWEALRALDPATLGGVVSTPAFGAWLATAEALVGRDAHRRLAGGHAGAHLGRLAELVLAAPLGGPLTLTFRLRAEPTVVLDAAARSLLVLPAPLAGAIVQVTADGPRRVVCDGPNVVAEVDLEHDEVAGAAALVRLPVVAGVVLDGGSPHRRHGADTRAFVDLGDPSLEEWVDRLGLALDLLSSVAPDLAREVLAVVRTVVPLVPSPDGAILNHTARAMFGVVASSLPATPAALAEVLVHEAQHSKLHVIEAAVDLVGDDDPADLPSPWRDDPRPAAAVLHGAASFAAVAELWAALAIAEGAPDRGAAAEAERRARQVRSACATLLACGRLTDEGLELAAAYGARAVAVLDAIPELEPGVRDRISATLAAHGAVEVPVPAPRAPRADEAELTEVECTVLELLEVPRGIPANALPSRQIRADPTAGSLGRWSVADPGRTTAVRAAVGSLPAPDPAAPERRTAAILRGHLAYLDRDFDTALDAYGAAAALDPEDLDRWADLAFCLRHLGRHADSTALLHRLDELAADGPEAARLLDRWAAP